MGRNPSPAVGNDRCRTVLYKFLVVRRIGLLPSGVRSPLSRVVVVEDAEDDALILCRLLEKGGLQVTPSRFSNAEEAVSHLSEIMQRNDPLEMPSALFADVWLPGLTGFDLLKWIRHQPALQAMTTVLLTGSDEPRDLGKAGKLGADCYLIKFPPPSAMREILAEIQHVAATPRPRPVLSVSCNLLNDTAVRG